MKFIMMSGIAGSGKTTIAKSLCGPDTVYISADEIRQELFGDVSDTEHTGQTFDTAHRRAIAALRAGKDVVYDSTNLNTRRRASMLRDLTRRFKGLQTELHLVLAEPKQCIANQLTRDRMVPTESIDKMVNRFTVPGLQEAWSEPIVVHNPFWREGMLDEYIAATHGVGQLGKWHQETVDHHQQLTAQYAAEQGFSDLVCEIAKIHDIGKPDVRFVDENGNAHFYGHANRGAYLYLCAMAKDGPLDNEVWKRAMLIQRHMDIMRKEDISHVISAMGEDLYQEMLDLYEADVHGAITREQVMKMPVLEFMNTFPDWEERIHHPPFCVTTKRDGDYVLLEYQQLNSDMKIKLVQESRGSIFRKNDDGEWMYVCRPFDKFFNHKQGNAAEIDWSTARVLEKVDGSFTKIFYDRNEWHLATNGTINAFRAHVSDLGYSYGDVFNRALGYDYHLLGAWLDPAYTYMFELTSPDTQLVVPYPDGVWYLSRRHTETGKEEFDRPKLPGVKYPKVFQMTKMDDVISVVSAMPKDKEGVVVNDAYSNRVKVKSPEYLIAAHLANNKMVSNRNLVVYMQQNKLDDFLAYCPQYTSRAQNILDRFHDKCNELQASWDSHAGLEALSRPEFASIAKQDPNAPYLFLRYGKPELSPAEFLLRQPTPTLMKALGLRTDDFSVDIPDIPCEKEDNGER